MGGGIPSLTGEELVLLLQRDGWELVERKTHGQYLRKLYDGKYRYTTVPTKGGALPDGTLGAILGPKQTSIGKAGLKKLIDGR